MIQIAATSRNAILAPAALAPGGDPAAFSLSLATMLDTPGQPVAVPGNALPPTPVAPVSAALSVLDTGVEQVAPTPAPIAAKAKEAPASASALSVDAAAVKPGGVAVRVTQPLPTSDMSRRIEANPRPTPVGTPAPALPAPLPVPLDGLPSQPAEPRGSLPIVDVKETVAISNPALPANPGEMPKQPTDLPQTPVAASPPHAPFLARTATKIASDPPVELGEVSEDDTTKGWVDLTPPAPPAPVPLDTMAAMQVALSPGSPRATVDAPVSTDPAPTVSAAVVVPQRLGAALPVAYDAPAQAARSTVVSPDLATLAPRSGETASGPAAIASAPAVLVSPKSPQRTAEHSHRVASQETVSRLVDPIALSADGTIPPDANRRTAIAPSPEDGERRYEADAAVRPTALASSPAPDVDDAPDGDGPTADRRVGDALARNVSRPQPGVEPAPVVTMAATTAAAIPSSTRSGAPPISRSLDAPAVFAPSPTPAHSRGVATAVPEPLTTPVRRDGTVASATGRADPAPLPASASAPPVSAVAPALPVAPVAPSTPQVSGLPLAVTPLPEAPGARSEAKPRTDGAPSRAPAPVTLVSPPRAQVPLIAAGATAPAFRLFAEAIHAARRDERAGDPLAPAPVATIDPTRAALPVGGAMLDMTDRRWPHAMIDRIEALRDAASASADAADTSIRLVPASLGVIDVSVRRDGDTVHVHFNAEQAATRALLTEAQPRLAELAEARGLKLGQASVGAGTDQNAQRHPAQQPARILAAPAPAVRDDEADTATTRVA